MTQKNLIKIDGGYIKIGNIHILIGIDSKSLINIKATEDVSNQNVHIFLTSPDDINNDFREMIKVVSMYMDDTRLTVHIPKFIRDVKPLIDLKEFSAVDGCKMHKYCTMVCESKGPSFRIPGTDNMLDIIYTKKGITSCIRLYERQYTGYKVQGCDPNSKDPMARGAINSIPRMNNPEMFKKDIIKSFKQSCPDGILSSFESDDDIWDYIMMNGEWSVINDKEENDV